jgi:hypothetical protein
MPWESGAQRRWGHTAAGEKALGGPAAVAEWDAATAGRELPEHAHHAQHEFSAHQERAMRHGNRHVRSAA